MDSASNGQVAILIDFENLVRGSDAQDSVDCDVLFRLGEEYGRVLVANAYADWRMKDVNQYQTDLCRLGVELVHVFGKFGGSGFKNAVDVKMAVDAIGAVSALPHITTFVIVSGDRDFIHVLKALRRHGKVVIGVSPASATSEDFAALCDRFVQYEALATAYEPQPVADDQKTDARDLDAVRQALQAVMVENPDGIKGAMIKPALRRRISPTFDESSYGFSRLTDLLRHLSDVVEVVFPGGGGDVLVRPATIRSSSPAPASTTEPAAPHRANDASLRFYRYEVDREKRRSILRRLFEAMSHRQPFAWTEIEDRMLGGTANLDGSLSPTTLSRYRSLLFQSRFFVYEPNQIGVPQRNRLARMPADIRSADDFISTYESGIAYKAMEALDDGKHLLPADLAKVLGLPAGDQSSLAYCRALLEGAAADSRARNVSN